jgi:hypothetical protein
MGLRSPSNASAPASSVEAVKWRVQSIGSNFCAELFCSRWGAAASPPTTRRSAEIPAPMVWKKVLLVNRTPLDLCATAPDGSENQNTILTVPEGSDSSKSKT